MIEPEPRTGLHRFTHDAMACTFGLTIVSPDARYARQAAQAAFDELGRLEGLLSRFVPHSDISRINALSPGQSARVSTETVECLQLASHLHATTHGAFDIAFRSAREADTPAGPPPLVFDPRHHAIGVQVAGVQLDLGGLGKGYALDRMVALLREWQITAALAHSGQSTVYALGHPPDLPAWHIGLRNPEEQDKTLDTLTLVDRALAGSGQRLHGQHIIDPRTSRPATSQSAAWALAPTAALADGLSTAFLVLTPPEVDELCGQHPDVSAILRPRTHQDPGVVCFPRGGDRWERSGGTG